MTHWSLTGSIITSVNYYLVTYTAIYSHSINESFRRRLEDCVNSVKPTPVSMVSDLAYILLQCNSLVTISGCQKSLLTPHRLLCIVAKNIVCLLSQSSTKLQPLACVQAFHTNPSDTTETKKLIGLFIFIHCTIPQHLSLVKYVAYMYADSLIVISSKETLGIHHTQ